MPHRPTIRLTAAALLYAAALLCAAALPAVAGGAILTGEDIERRAAAAEVQLRTGPGYAFPVTITLRPGGSMEGISANGYVDVGRWWTRGDTLCHQWDTWFDGARKCHAVTADGAALTLAKPDADAFRSTSMKLRKRGGADRD